ncbi:MAG: GNAT family N-acetyltransferase [Bdellovibrionales bacterium]
MFESILAEIVWKLLASFIAILFCLSLECNAQTCAPLFADSSISIHPPIAFKTHSLEARKILKSETDQLMQILTSEGADQYFFSGQYTREMMSEFLDSFIAKSPREEITNFNSFRRGDEQAYAVFQSNTGKMVGIIKFNLHVEEGRVLLGRIIHHDFRNRGFATELDLPIMQFIKSNYGVKDFTTLVDEKNIPSNLMMFNKSVFEYVDTIDYGKYLNTGSQRFNRFDYTLAD